MGRTKPQDGLLDRIGQLGTPAALYVPARVLGKDVHFLYDTGATVTCLSSKFWSSILERERPELQGTKRKLTTVGGHAIPVEGATKLVFELDGRPVTCQVQICGIGEDAVLDVDLLSDLRVQWDWGQSRLVWPTSDLAADCHKPVEDSPDGDCYSGESGEPCLPESWTDESNQG